MALALEGIVAMRRYKLQVSRDHETLKSSTAPAEQDDGKFCTYTL